MKVPRNKGKQPAKRLPAVLLDPRIIAINERLLVIDLESESRLIPNGETIQRVQLPRLLLAAMATDAGGHQLHAVAVRRKGRLSAESPLFHAPLMGVTADGRALTDGVGLPVSIDPREVDEWVQVFRSLAAGAVAHERTLRASGMAAGASINTYHHTRFWRELARDRADRFPSRALVSRRQVLGEWLECLDWVAENT